MAQRKKDLLKLYKVLHPEDKDIKEEELTNVTIKNVLIDKIYNDLGFMARDRLMILIEAQTKIHHTLEGIFRRERDCGRCKSSHDL